MYADCKHISQQQLTMAAPAGWFEVVRVQPVAGTPINLDARGES